MSEKRKRHIPTPSAKTGVHIVVEENNDDATPLWCFAHLRKGWDMNELRDDQKVAFLDSLVKRSSLSWKDLKLQDRKKLGFESIAGSSLKDNIPTIAEGENIFAFRIGDVGRFLGVRSGKTFHIIWIDCTYTLYKH